MTDSKRRLDDLKKLAISLVDDLRGRTDDVSEVQELVQRQYREAHDAARTDRSYEEWREDLLAQVAVGWVVGTVFVRFCEDNRLFDPPLLSGPGERRGLAGDHRAQWLAAHPAAGDREWLEDVFARYRAIPATSELFGEYNPLWQFGPTADGAKSLLSLWQSVDHETGDLAHDFTDASLDTRFLGDLYQDLSDHAKNTYALLQTPDFVEAFIQDRTLEPALDTFGLDGFRMIDPTCGSGHFLLGAFDRILERWRRKEPGTPVRELVQRTLDSVNGVDLNPFAAAIARFRLLVSALLACGIGRLVDAPAFRVHVAVGDSLLHGTRKGELFTGVEGFGSLLRHRYPTEDGDRANQLLKGGRYHAVVGNPPYITVKDPALRDAYRGLYDSCYRQYSLGVPFTERFIDLSTTPRESGGAGFVGMITTNTFMKREFGKKLVEEFLPTIDVTHIIDTSGAYIPGHGTPTVILFARHRSPVEETVRTVLGIRGEPRRPDDPGTGEVWTSIYRMVDNPGAENEYLSVENAPRVRYSSHPWSLQGGAAPAVFHSVERSATKRLASLTTAIGRTTVVGEDDAWVAPLAGDHARRGVDVSAVPFVVGEVVRDWKLLGTPVCIYPYEAIGGRVVGGQNHTVRVVLWPLRTLLRQRTVFGKSFAQRELPWWSHLEHYTDKLRTPLSITFAFVATHNHFVLDRGGKVFKQSAPVIKLPADATEEQHLELLGLLNSSAACFWMKQVFHNKGSQGVNEGVKAEAWERFYEHDGTKLKQFPIPAGSTLAHARTLDRLAQDLTATLPASLLAESPPTRTSLDTARERAAEIRRRMGSVQEELDWQCHALYGLTEEELTHSGGEPPPLEKGQRAFEIVLARAVAAGDVASTWFERHDSTPITELPADWPDPYRALVERRIEVIDCDRALKLLERPEYKRRWNWDSWDDLEEAALRSWLLDRLEAPEFWCDSQLTTTARLADRLRRDPDLLEAAEVYKARVDFELADLVTGLVLEEAVPHAAGYRYKTSGLRKRRAWEEVWEKQRHQDAVEARTELHPDDPDHLSEADAEANKLEQGLDRITVPPKYKSTDFASTVYWRMRGKLDVPKERFVLVPNTTLGADTSPVIGWAGWDHLAQARALAGHYQRRKDEGAEAPELFGLLAGLQERVPWLLQWHNEVDPKFGQRMGDFFSSFVATEARAHGVTVDDLVRWTPA